MRPISFNVATVSALEPLWYAMEWRTAWMDLMKLPAAVVSVVCLMIRFVMELLIAPVLAGSVPTSKTVDVSRLSSIALHPTPASQCPKSRNFYKTSAKPRAYCKCPFVAPACV